MLAVSWYNRTAPMLFAMFAASLSINSFAVGRPKITGAQEIDPEGPYKYGAASAYDRKIDTAWCTNPSKAADFWLKIDHEWERSFSGVGIINGVAKSGALYRNNSRPKEILIEINGKLSSTAVLSDDLNPQWISFDQTKGRSVKITIKSVYSGAKYADICITEIIDDQELFIAYSQLAVVEKGAAGAIRAAEIKKVYSQFFATTYQTQRPQGAKPIFWEAIRLRVSHRDERALRILLDLLFFAQDGVARIDAELLEGLKAMIIPFLQKEPRIVLRVLQDSGQVSREGIANAYNNLVSNFTYDPKTGKITDKGYTEDLQEIGRLIKGFKLPEK